LLIYKTDSAAILFPPDQLYLCREKKASFCFLWDKQRARPVYTKTEPRPWAALAMVDAE
jgi:hypothetical protein